MEDPQPGTPSLSDGEPPADRGVADAVRRVLGGDREAFRCLVEEHQQAVLGICRGHLRGNASEAEDVTQDTFLRAYKFLERLEDPERFAPWLYQIARSLARERRRRMVVERRALAERSEVVRRRSLGRPEEENDVSAALDELPEEERKVLMLRYFDGLPYDEITKRLGLTFPQVDHLIRKARARLSRRLAVKEQVEQR
ncbi:MAG TPA: sigma-70 family RNA polymerase sigma factor [Planctomycetota bacterium]|nr:sigma-70 family RNA polymerase sigma factor [Planctomycetota bacterium]